MYLCHSCTCARDRSKRLEDLLQRSFSPGTKSSGFRSSLSWRLGLAPTSRRSLMIAHFVASVIAIIQAAVCSGDQLERSFAEFDTGRQRNNNLRTLRMNQTLLAAYSESCMGSESRALTETFFGKEHVGHGPGSASDCPEQCGAVSLSPSRSFRYRLSSTFTYGVWRVCNE